MQKSPKIFQIATFRQAVKTFGSVANYRNYMREADQIIEALTIDIDRDLVVESEIDDTKEPADQ